MLHFKSNSKGHVDNINIIQDYVSMTMRNSCEAVELYNSSTYLSTNLRLQHKALKVVIIAA